jgi:iron complex outermembrane receptor protein
VSEDIAAFPDLNLAESLQRIPGVTISRDSGEGRQITLRGLGPDFTRTQLNGMEVLGNTASGMDNRGGVSRTRSFDYSLFASELFNRVTVQKSSAAEQDEGGIGGTVQLTTAKPFDYPGFKAVLSAKAQQNSNADDKITPRVVGLISNRWGDFGALASVAYGVNDSNEFGYRSFNWGPIRANAANIGPGVSAADAAKLTAATPTIFAPQADTYSTWYDRRKRLGATAVAAVRARRQAEAGLRRPVQPAGEQPPELLAGHLGHQQPDRQHHRHPGDAERRDPGQHPDRLQLHGRRPAQRVQPRGRQDQVLPDSG